MKGKVKWFNAHKGFGFITGEDGRDVFVHHTAIKEKGFRNLEEGQEVEYGVVQNAKGDCASEVVKVSVVKESK